MMKYLHPQWIGLIFNNILFSAAYQLTLAVKDKDGIIAQKLSNTNINFLSHFFPSEENKGRWLFIKFDNYLITLARKTARVELEAKVKEIFEGINNT